MGGAEEGARCDQARALTCRLAAGGSDPSHGASGRRVFGGSSIPRALRGFVSRAFGAVVRRALCRTSVQLVAFHKTSSLPLPLRPGECESAAGRRGQGCRVTLLVIREE